MTAPELEDYLPLLFWAPPHSTLTVADIYAVGETLGFPPCQQQQYEGDLDIWTRLALSLCR